ncbi:MAG: bifunctional adenosylcobinamide kinase/adenosylcobinamide-phosphate guanylyltransferase [Lachnospiraceae bacterium]|nr:bifunctional adenosylcobinamide kinase/adenosylcobinamide-phosphate guanylyltransferase [Lachnospiraceae bacterium]
MKIITGGRYGGKLDYVIETFEIKEDEILDMSLFPAPDIKKKMEGQKVLYRLESFIRSALEYRLDPESVIMEYISDHPDSIVICDEVGSGIVPEAAEDDEWREVTGRIMCELTKLAGGMTRVTFGVPEELRCDII